MNDETTTLDQTDEEIFAYTVSDEALEAAVDSPLRKGAVSPITTAQSTFVSVTFRCPGC
jgi:hypothetical protein